MNLDDVRKVLENLGFEKRFNTEQTAVCVGVLYRLNKRLRIHDIIAGAKRLFSKSYAENTRESIRKLSMKKLVQAGLVIQNEDDPSRPINSGSNNYVLEGKFKAILDAEYSERDILIKTWKSKHRDQIIEKIKVQSKKHEIPIKINDERLVLSSGEHNVLIKQIVEILIPLKFKESVILYVGDTKNKQFYINKKLSNFLGYDFDIHDKIPDVIAYLPKVKSLIMIESVTSVGPIEESRKEEIKKLVTKSMERAKIKDIIYVTCFLDLSTFGKFSRIIAFGSHVWIAARPRNLISYL